MKTNRAWGVLGLFLLQSTYYAYALDQIIRPYQSVRSVGMGGVKITTGLYDENFFNNPARVTANPRTRFTLLQLTGFELNSATIKTASNLINGGTAQHTIAGAAGSNLHDRFQVILPAFYLAANENRKFAIAFGMIASVQLDADLRQSYQIDTGAYSDVGPAVTVGHKFLDDALSVGITGHVIYRLATNPNYSLLDYVSGTPPDINSTGGQGAMLDFDLGGTYKITEWEGFDVSVGAAMQNILGGNYNNLSFKPLQISGAAPAQPRSMGVGISLNRPSWFLFRNTSFALEATDLFNNANGSLFRLLHAGAETWLLGILAVRVGLNQGYLAAGLGLDLRFLTLDAATYGEELGLNAGIMQDRRYTVNVGIHI